MRSIAEIDRDHEGMGPACVRFDYGCTYPACECDRAQRVVPNVRGVPAATNKLLHSLERLRYHIVFDEEGDLTREQFEAMLEQADRAINTAIGDGSTEAQQISSPEIPDNSPDGVPVLPDGARPTGTGGIKGIAK